MKILVIEDDPIIRKSLHQGLTEAGHDCEAVRDGHAGLLRASAILPDLVILDLMLPEVPGLEVLKQMREQGLKCPVIVLTALGTVDDRVTGLKAGADDYLPKPFEFPELLARIEAVTRRATTHPPTSLDVQDLSLDLTTRRVAVQGHPVDLTPTEFSILELLMRFAGQVVTRKMLCEHVWGFTWDGNTNVIEVHINRLRQKLDVGRDDSRIQTIRGRGYALR